MRVEMRILCFAHKLLLTLHTERKRRRLDLLFNFVGFRSLYYPFHGFPAFVSGYLTLVATIYRPVNWLPIPHWPMRLFALPLLLLLVCGVDC